MRDLHVHTTYCDGNASPEEMVVAAIEKGLACLGFSAHSYTFFDTSYCIKKESIAAYKSEIAALAQKYRGKIEILTGIEQDIYSTESVSGFDYVIGSVHYAKTDEGYFGIDDSEEDFVKLVRKRFGGDFYALAENYFSAVSKICEKISPDIIGHFDLVTKYNEGGKYFDEQHPRYVSAYRKAADALLKENIPFEINTGAIARGYRSTPYPSKDIFEYISKHGGRFVFSSDAHSVNGICFEFEKWKKEYGLTKMTAEVLA